MPGSIGLQKKDHDSLLCGCGPCRAKRGEYKGQNNPNFGNHKLAGQNAPWYKDGRSLREYLCVTCNKEISLKSGFYGSHQCASCVKKGRTHTREHTEKIKRSCAPYAFRKGHETNVGRTPWNKGRRCPWSESARLRNRNSPYQFKKGALHPNWKGGVSTLNALIRQITKYKRWQRQILHRDNHRCVICGSNKRTEVHHILSLVVLIRKFSLRSLEEAYRCPELWEIANGETRCGKCHRLTRAGLSKS